jgi:hypothetical protein
MAFNDPLKRLISSFDILCICPKFQIDHGLNSSIMEIPLATPSLFFSQKLL